jgi:cell division protein FtsZ
MQGSHMAFVAAGMGGGTGTGAAPVIARAAKEMGILTVGVVTKPFSFEGSQRMKLAEAGIRELQQYVDTLIIIPNQNLFRVANEKTTFADAFKMADNVLQSGVRGITDLMVMPGLINLDFADVRSVMSEMGKAMMGTGEAEGDHRAIEAAERAIANPLLDDISMKGARGVLINITGGPDLTLFEVDEAANRIREEVDPEANIIVGSTLDANMEGRMRVSVVATGIDAAAQQGRSAAAGLARAAPGDAAAGQAGQLRRHAAPGSVSGRRSGHAGCAGGPAGRRPDHRCPRSGSSGCCNTDDRWGHCSGDAGAGGDHAGTGRAGTAGTWCSAGKRADGAGHAARGRSGGFRGGSPRWPKPLRRAPSRPSWPKPRQSSRHSCRRRPQAMPAPVQAPAAPAPAGSLRRSRYGQQAGRAEEEGQPVRPHHRRGPPRRGRAGSGHASGRTAVHPASRPSRWPRRRPPLCGSIRRARPISA